MIRLPLIFSYFKNDRISEYEKIILLALRSNYTILSLRDYIEKEYSKDSKILILRHDVDHPSKATRMMFEIEKRLGVKSSFYFRNSTYEPQLMLEIERYGSEASLHFEPIADIAKAYDVKSKKELSGIKHWQMRCLAILKADLERFRNLLDIPCITIASHGELENSLVGIPNNFLTENDEVYEELGIKLEAYNKKFINDFDMYISDSPIEVNQGFRYDRSPLQAIEMKCDKIIFLTHPNHWHYSFIKQWKKIIKILLFGEKKYLSEFKRI